MRFNVHTHSNKSVSVLVKVVKHNELQLRSKIRSTFYKFHIKVVLNNMRPREFDIIRTLPSAHGLRVKIVRKSVNVCNTY